MLDMAIRSQAQQQCWEGSETRTNSPEPERSGSSLGPMKFHECLTAKQISLADNIVRYSVEMRRVVDKKPHKNK